METNFSTSLTRGLMPLEMSYPANIYLFKVKNKNTWMAPLTSSWLLLLLTWNKQMLAGYLALKVPEVIYHRIWDQVHFKKIKVLRNEVLTVPLIFDKKHWPWSNIELTVFAMTEEKILGSDSRHSLSCIYYLIYDFEKWGGINISTYVKENNI